MAVFREGDSGPKVKALQKQLKKRGFNPGVIDGDFGPGTEAAVMAFQKSEGLLADGIVGPRTQKDLGLGGRAAPPSAIAEVSVKIVSKMFPFTPMDNIKRHLPAVLDGLVERDLGEKPMILMALATIRAETEGFEPISEGRSRYNTSPGGHPFDLYDHRRDLGNQGDGDGDRFKGRGFIQLTGRANYKTHGEAVGLGQQLIKNPDLANDSVIAARLLSSFLKNKEQAVKRALLEGDLRSARRYVNGGSHGLDRFMEAFQIGDRLMA